MKLSKPISVYTAQGFQASLHRHMPPSTFRDFNLWALSPQNPHQEVWLQIIGIPQFAKLTDLLLGEAVSPDQWDELMQYTIVMNAYLIYETVSDNLAFGLAEHRSDDLTYDLRREVLIQFNNAMIARLHGRVDESNEIMEAIKPMTAQLSGFQQSLTCHEQQAMAKLFLEAHPHQDYCMDDIEFGTWNALVANIEACADVVDTMKDFRLIGTLRNGLIRRYAAVNDLLCQNVNNREKLLQVSTDTILVIPVLTYYISVLNEALNPNPRLAIVLGNDVLCEALQDAALMVRLLNDMGTNLVTTDEFHRRLLDDLYADVSKSVSKTSVLFPHLLIRHSEKAGFMTRIHKDLSYGEFNVSLHNLMTAPCSLITLLLFGDNLLYFKQQYKHRQSRLKDNLKSITQTLGDDISSGLIHKFVHFHEQIYKQQFDQQDGDYATKPDLVTIEN